MSTTARLSRLSVGALLLATTAAPAACAQSVPAQNDPAHVEVSTWSNPTVRPHSPELGGVLLDTADAEVMLALTAVGAAAMAVRGSTRKEH